MSLAFSIHECWKRHLAGETGPGVLQGRCVAGVSGSVNIDAEYTMYTAFPSAALFTEEPLRVSVLLMHFDESVNLPGINRSPIKRGGILWTSIRRQKYSNYPGWIVAPGLWRIPGANPSESEPSHHHQLTSVNTVSWWYHSRATIPRHTIRRCVLLLITIQITIQS